jgi:hypothetical protein
VFQKEWAMSKSILVAGFVLLGLAIVCSAINPAAPTQESKDIFLTIPANTRDTYVERLHLVVEYQRTHQWADLFDLLFDPSPKTKDAFVKRNRKYFVRPGEGLLDFHPERADLLPIIATRSEEQWVVRGCATFKYKGQIQSHTSVVYSAFRNGQWFFSPVLITGRCMPTDPDPCELKQSAATK